MRQWQRIVVLVVVLLSAGTGYGHVPVSSSGGPATSAASSLVTPGTTAITASATSSASQFASPVATPMPRFVSLPPQLAPFNVTLVATDGAPLLSQEQAMKIVTANVPMQACGTYQGKPITVQAWYGYATIGRPTAMGWDQYTRIPLPNGGLAPDHVDNRLVWVLDYGNVPGVIPSICYRCPPPPVTDHNVYAVDAQYRVIVWGASYTYSTTASPATPQPTWPATQPLTAAAAEWRQVVAVNHTAMQPILAPSVLPDGFTSVGDPGNNTQPGLFTIDYAGPGKELMILVGSSSRPAPESLTEVRQVTVRGQPGTLQVVRTVRGVEGLRLWWQEPGHLEPWPKGSPAQASVPYFLWAVGLTQDQLLQFADTMTQISPASSATPSSGTAAP